MGFSNVVDACSPDPNARVPWVQERGVSVLGDYWTCMTTGKELLMHESNQKITCARRQLYHQTKHALMLQCNCYAPRGNIN